jgi:hypothetical protein
MVVDLITIQIVVLKINNSSVLAVDRELVRSIDCLNNCLLGFRL